MSKDKEPEEIYFPSTDPHVRWGTFFKTHDVIRAIVKYLDIELKHGEPIEIIKKETKNEKDNPGDKRGNQGT
jgi:hypothetical protein